MYSPVDVNDNILPSSLFTTINRPVLSTTKPVGRRRTFSPKDLINSPFSEKTTTRLLSKSLTKISLESFTATAHGNFSLTASVVPSLIHLRGVKDRFVKVKASENSFISSSFILSLSKCNDCYAACRYFLEIEEDIKSFPGL